MFARALQSLSAYFGPWASLGRKRPSVGTPRTDLHRWPDGSLRWLPHKETSGPRNITNDWRLRRALRLAVR